MQLLRLDNLELSSDDRVYRHSPGQALLVALTGVLAFLVLLFYAFTVGWKPGYYFATFILLFLAIMRRSITACFRPTNWLVRMSPVGLFIKFRSYLNYHLPAEDPIVAFIPYQEIRSARLVRERAKFSLVTRSRTATQTFRYVELELGIDPAPLAEALRTELAKKAPKEKRWYGSSSTLYEDYPVRMPSPPFLQVQWSVVPRAQTFLDALRPYTTIAEPVVVEEDLLRLQALSEEEQEARLRALVRKGNIVPAIYTIRKLYGCGLKEAQHMVERLHNEGQPGVSSPPQSAL